MAAELEEKRPSTSDPDDSDGESFASFSLSLCDFPLAGHGRSDCPSFCGDRQLSHPPPTGPFEFLSSDLSAAEEMCSAEDVFLQGKLLPYKPPSPHRYPNKRGDAPDPKIALFDHRRSESLDSISRPRGGGVLATECWRLRRAASDSDPITHLPPPAPRSRPKWYLVAFGSVRVPATMEMKDIRNRQRRRRSPLLAECGRWGHMLGRGPWKLLRSLSCNGAESAVVSPPLSFLSHVRG